MNQLLTLIVTDWILPNAEKDTPLRWIARAGMLAGAGIFVAYLN